MMKKCLTFVVDLKFKTKKKKKAWNYLAWFHQNVLGGKLTT